MYLVGGSEREITEVGEIYCRAHLVLCRDILVIFQVGFVCLGLPRSLP